MREPRGHVKIARKAFDPVAGDRWWLEPREFSKWEAWVDLIQLAQWTDFRHVTKYGPVDLKRGEFLASLRWLGERWQWGQERVRRYLKDAEETSRLARQSETRAGIVYHIVNYDAYQGSAAACETVSETVSETATRQQRDKNKQLKHSKQKETTGANAPFPKAIADALYEAWIAKRGAVNYGALRKALAPLFPAVGARFTTTELLNGIEAFAELAEVDKPEFSHKWTVFKFAAEAQRWVKLGALPYVDDWGIPTERGYACKLFTPDLPTGRYVA